MSCHKNCLELSWMLWGITYTAFEIDLRRLKNSFAHILHGIVVIFFWVIPYYEQYLKWFWMLQGILYRTYEIEYTYRIISCVIKMNSTWYSSNFTIKLSLVLSQNNTRCNNGCLHYCSDGTTSFVDK